MSRAADDRPLTRDEVLAEQRTELAWSRSGLALLAAVAILVRRILTDGRDDSTALAIVLTSAAAIAWAVGTLRASRDASRDAVHRPGELALISVGTVALAAAGFVVALVD